MAGSVCDSAGAYFDALSSVMAQVDRAAIDRFAQMLFEAWRDDRAVLVLGNGGSAYNASHHVCDYVKTAAVESRRRLRALSLVDNLGMGTAIGNDIGFEDVFRHPLESYGRAGDLVVAMSCSGTSPNVVAACQWARNHGMVVAALTGFAGGALKDLADVHINIPSDNYGVIEDLHLSIGHIAAQSLHKRIAKESAA